jgi:hypothetical protein
MSSTSLAGNTQADEPQQGTPSSVPDAQTPLKAPQLSLPSGGGGIKPIDQKFSVNPVTGTGGIQIPIPTTAGRNGAGPSLLLSYDSGAGNGPFGIGWNVDFPSIHRKTDKGWPRYSTSLHDEDVFVLSNAEDLVPKLSDDAALEMSSGRDAAELAEMPINGFMVRQYVPRVEGPYIRIERWTSIENPSEIHWRTITGANTTTIYGSDDSSRIFTVTPAGGKNIFSWLVRESYDDKGEAVLYEWKSEDADNVARDSSHECNRNDEARTSNRYIKSIKYGNKTPNRNLQTWELQSSLSFGAADWMFEVVFDYGEHDVREPSTTQTTKWPCRLDPFSKYHAGFEVRTYRLCHRVLLFHHLLDKLHVDDYLVSATE